MSWMPITTHALWRSVALQLSKGHAHKHWISSDNPIPSLNSTRLFQRLGFFDGHRNLTTIRCGVAHRITLLGSINGSADR